jgi:hypothetical protein
MGLAMAAVGGQWKHRYNSLGHPAGDITIRNPGYCRKSPPSTSRECGCSLPACRSPPVHCYYIAMGLLV